MQHWQVDEAGLDGLLAELSKKPGIHAVHLSADGQVQAAPPTTKSR
ncbi:PPE17 domain protein [Mycobacterium xenopi 4042]|uniref:PPE17 domain protein n=1 Tax=Mycobacterium xenopi 4042 TaxID=1299334 RepID=X8BGN1_MYCXE|nr:PPE17 domain protein [Mycobacterium xenopi 3993]EUA42646.1 PPE17 domain protein [Mycobacterium xenopi 4042]